MSLAARRRTNSRRCQASRRVLIRSRTNAVSYLPRTERLSDIFLKFYSVAVHALLGPSLGVIVVLAHTLELGPLHSRDIGTLIPAATAPARLCRLGRVRVAQHRT
jgi:hypothetical protein